MTTQEKLARLNELRALNGKEPLKAWKQSGAKLDWVIANEEAAFNSAGAAAGDSVVKPPLYTNEETGELEEIDLSPEGPLNQALTTENTNAVEGFEATEEELAQQTVRPVDPTLPMGENGNSLVDGDDTVSYAFNEGTNSKGEPAVPAKPKSKGKDKPKASADKFKTVRECAEHYLRENPEAKHADVATLVRGHFKDAKTTAASVAWYASKMKKKK